MEVRTLRWRPSSAQEGATGGTSAQVFDIADEDETVAEEDEKGADESSGHGWWKGTIRAKDKDGVYYLVEDEDQETHQVTPNKLRLDKARVQRV